jgi:hypothetical protein
MSWQGISADPAFLGPHLPRDGGERFRSANSDERRVLQNLRQREKQKWHRGERREALRCPAPRVVRQSPRWRARIVKPWGRGFHTDTFRMGQVSVLCIFSFVCLKPLDVSFYLYVGTEHYGILVMPRPRPHRCTTYRQCYAFPIGSLYGPSKIALAPAPRPS